jgi:hypothetical protein
LGGNDQKRGNALEGEHKGNDTGPEQQSRAAPSRLNPCIHGCEAGVNYAATAAIIALAGNVAAATRAFWPRRSSSNRRWLAHEIVQQPVYTIAAKISKRA